MGLTSSVPYFKAALKARLEADTVVGAQDVGVSRGLPHPTTWPNKAVIVGNATNRRLSSVAGMTQAREEYDVEVTINVTGARTTQYETLEEAAYTLASAVLASINDWTQDGGALASGSWGTVNAALPSDGGADHEGYDETTRDATVTLPVHVIARLIGG